MKIYWRDAKKVLPPPFRGKGRGGEEGGEKADIPPLPLLIPPPPPPSAEEPHSLFLGVRDSTKGKRFLFRSSFLNDGMDSPWRIPPPLSPLEKKEGGSPPFPPFLPSTVSEGGKKKGGIKRPSPPPPPPFSQ